MFTSSHLYKFSSFSVFTVGKTSGHVPSWFGSTRKSWLPSGQKSSLKDALHTPKSNVAVKMNPINFAMFANLDWIENWYDAHLLYSENNFQSYCCEQQFLRIFCLPLPRVYLNHTTWTVRNKWEKLEHLGESQFPKLWLNWLF